MRLQVSHQRKFAATREDILVEQSLIEKAQQGDPHAIGALYELHAPRIRRLLVGIIGPGDQVDDLLQDVFLQVFLTISAFRGDSRFSTWLHRVASNLAISYLRRKKRTPPLVDDTQFPASAAVQSESAQARAALTELYTILDSLSPKRRLAFVLFEIEQYTISEIAEMTGSNIATIKSRLFFGRREILKKSKDSPVLRELMTQSAGNRGLSQPGTV
ncbi:MAG: sigma-70 family RNA polymerase sigma factor [Deltaproteobacteria bacterium]|nr:sigma-70 family RNA polymerase sigma factor [Deltaproteobacteria bacterium]